jgi:hypothetical protein
VALAGWRTAQSGLSKERVWVEMMLAPSIAIWGLVMKRRGFIGLLGRGRCVRHLLSFCCNDAGYRDNIQH